MSNDDEFFRWSQHVFNRVYLGLKSQGWEKSWDEVKNMCSYRGPNGLKCAVGHLMTDDEVAAYSPRCSFLNWEFLSLDELNFSAFVVLSESTRYGAGYSFLCELQDLHDQSVGPHNMKARFIQFADERGLRIPT